MQRLQIRSEKSIIQIYILIFVFILFLLFFSRFRNKIKVDKLFLFQGCGTDKQLTGHFAVPSLRLDTVPKEYLEPVRDRDKNWALDSQRGILLSPPKSKYQQIEEQSSIKPLKLGSRKHTCMI